MNWAICDAIIVFTSCRYDLFPSLCRKGLVFSHTYNVFTPWRNNIFHLGWYDCILSNQKYFFGLSCINRYGTISSKTKLNETEIVNYPDCYRTDTEPPLLLTEITLISIGIRAWISRLWLFIHVLTPTVFPLLKLVHGWVITHNIKQYIWLIIH